MIGKVNVITWCERESSVCLHFSFDVDIWTDSLHDSHFCQAKKTKAFNESNGQLFLWSQKPYNEPYFLEMSKFNVVF